MKMLLDVDQRKLLKLRSSVLIESEQDDKKSVFRFKKVIDEEKMLTLYVDNLL